VGCQERGSVSVLIAAVKSYQIHGEGDPMSDRTDKIRERAEKATPGPWRHEDDHEGSTMGFVGAQHPEYPTITTRIFDVCGDSGQAYEDAQFIAHARTDIPYLLAEVSSLESQLKQAQEELAKWKYAAGRITNVSVKFSTKLSETLNRAESAESRLQAVSQALRSEIELADHREVEAACQDFDGIANINRHILDTLRRVEKVLAPPTEPTERKP
jgi:hypothetical protein